jgi:bacterioferritin-associated ferredoxin
MTSHQLTIIRIHIYPWRTVIEGRMYVCICNAVTDRDIRRVVDKGARSLFEVQCHLPVGSCCGRCQDEARNVVDEHLQKKSGAECPLVCTPALA